jgi:nitrogenase-stabilizing/protective protein
MTNEEFERDLEELSSAEDFLCYFGVAFDPQVVQVNRLHILQRFHDYLAQVEAMPEDAEQRRALYAGLLVGAYTDFVRSDARTEKVFRVFHRSDPSQAAVALSDLVRQLPSAS